MGFCPTCGAQLAADARFCARCGNATSTPAGSASIATWGSGQAAVAPEPRQHADNSTAWLLAAAPLLSLCIDAALLLRGNVEAALYGTLIAIALNTILAIIDSRSVKRQGYSVSTALALFLIPIYLIQRARATQQAQSITAAWVMAFIVSLAAGAALQRSYGAVQLDMPTVEAGIKSQVDAALDTDSTVKCPSESTYQVHDTFVCVVADASRLFDEQVTVENGSGDVAWQPTG